MDYSFFGASLVMITADSFYCSLSPTLRLNRIINGLWQVSGSHGVIDPPRAIAAMADYATVGLTTWDLAEHYDGAADLLSKFQQQDTAATRPTLCVKWFPRPSAMTRSVVETFVDRTLAQLNAPQLDLLQLHWWDYRDNRYLDALKHLSDLQQLGKLKAIALTNFDSKHLQRVLDEDIPIVANQVQFSVLDQRPLTAMIPLCQERNIQLLAYGTLGGGFFTERFLDARDPQWLQLTTASLRKYRNMINAWGSWRQFQELLQTLQAIADRHQVSLANIALRYILEQPQVASVIVGTRLGIRDHLDDNLRVFDFQLDPGDRQTLVDLYHQGNNLYQTIGDCGSEYRHHT